MSEQKKEIWYMYQFIREVRYYKNKLTLLDKNTIYLGTVTERLSDHWQPTVKLTGYSSDNLEIDKKYKNKKILKFSEDQSLLDFKNRLKSELPVSISGKTIQVDSISKTKAPYGKYISNFSAFKCCYCQDTLSRETYTREHIIPKSSYAFKYASTKYKTYQLIRPCCISCNTEKSNMFLDEYIAFLEKKLKFQIPGTDSYIKTMVKIISASDFLKIK